MHGTAGRLLLYASTLELLMARKAESGTGSHPGPHAATGSRTQKSLGAHEVQSTPPWPCPPTPDCPAVPVPPPLPVVPLEPPVPPVTELPPPVVVVLLELVPSLP